MGMGLALALLLVRFVVALRVGHEIGEGETVVGGDVVDRLPRPPRLAVENIARAREARRKILALPGVAAPELADAVAEAVVPLRESRRVVAELIPARAEVPRLGDELDAGEDRILPQRVEEAGAGIEAVGLAPQGDAEVETEPVDVERGHPVAQRIHQ